MRAKPFTFSVIVTAVTGALSLASQQIDKQEALLPHRVAVQPVASRSLSTASPLDIDPRRMEAPAPQADTQGPVPPAVTARTRLASGSFDPPRSDTTFR